MFGITDVIAAVSTPPGKGGVAVIRLSGEGAYNIAKRIFRPIGKDFDSLPPRYAGYGYIVDPRINTEIDDVLITKFPAPNSYTGEETVEISCHGGILVTGSILELLLTNGARHAAPGEFTRRAFLNGKLSLTEAEAIGMLLSAESSAQLRLSSGSSRARLEKRISKIRNDLVSVLSSVFARIDYPDEDLGDFSDEELYEKLKKIQDDLSGLMSTYKTGRAVNEGIPTVIAGKPNVGKSTLYNLLVGEEAAIVTDIPGTTRDVLSSGVSLGSVMLRLADTAGIRSGNLDLVEQLGIEKSEKMLSECELLFAVFDISRVFDKEDEFLISKIKASNSKKIAILNKSDKEPLFDTERLDGCFERVITVSAKASEDKLINELRSAVEELFIDGETKIGEDAIIASARQNAALERGFESLNVALTSLSLGFMQDAVAGDIERALSAISELDGRAVSEEVVADIFSKFCVGK